MVESDRTKAILFDNDGTLVDTQELILTSMRYTMQTVLGKDFPDEKLLQKVGQPLDVQFWDYTDDPGIHDQLCRIYRHHNHHVHDQMISLFPDTETTLKHLRDAGYRLAVVTGKRHALAWHGLEITGIAPYFEFLIGADDCEAYKPDPAPLLLAARRLKLAPSQCIYVGDSPVDIEAGNRAGMVTVAALWGMFPAEVLQAESPSFECHTMNDLTRIPPLTIPPSD